MPADIFTGEFNRDFCLKGNFCPAPLSYKRNLDRKFLQVKIFIQINPLKFGSGNEGEPGTSMNTLKILKLLMQSYP